VEAYSKVSNNNNERLDTMQEKQANCPNCGVAIKILLTDFDESELVMRLSKDLKEAVKLMTPKEVRFTVDQYYTLQSNRIRAAGQVRAMTESKEPNTVLQWLTDKSGVLENQVKAALFEYANSRLEGRWLMSLVGIGPVLAAALMSNTNPERATTAGKLQRFAGLDPTKKWLGVKKANALYDTLKDASLEEMIIEAAEKVNTTPELLTALMRDKTGNPVMTGEALRKAMARCPWNARFKTACWKCSDMFVKFSGRDDCFYGAIYKKRKAQEIAYNSQKKFADQAAQKLKDFKIGKSTDAYKAYIQGYLPDAHLHARAMRYTVKVLLSHWQLVAYWCHFKTLPPAPYALVYLKPLGHTHLIKPPNLELFEEFKPLIEKLKAEWPEWWVD